MGISDTLYYLAIAILVVVLFIPVTTLLFSFVASARKYWNALKSKKAGEHVKRWSDYSTALYSGRVSHTRFQPVTHGFSYPLFFMCIDLKEVDELFHGTENVLWPLNILMQFCDSDHLKNGEGLQDKESSDEKTIYNRIRILVSERTEGKCQVKDGQKIYILTHLRYFGYCFNPVSFYYIMKEGGESIEAIVAEVSNTPWNEMSCYVLHEDSTDISKVQPGRQKNNCQAINYIFLKTFHVSPFMEMDHIYDWTFWTPNGKQFIVSTDMKHKKSGLKYFNAYFDLLRKRFTPFALCYQLMKLPVYCVVIQVWIHIEAFKVFWKGVEFVPHPEGAETEASRIIAKLMVPFFALTDWMNRTKSKQEKQQ